MRNYDLSHAGTHVINGGHSASGSLIKSSAISSSGNYVSKNSESSHAGTRVISNGRTASDTPVIDRRSLSSGIHGMKRHIRTLSRIILAGIMAALLLPARSALSDPFDNVAIGWPTERTLERYEGEAPRKGVNWFDFGDNDLYERFHIEYDINGGRDFTKTFVHAGSATVVAAPGETITIGYKAKCDWPFAIPWSKENDDSPEFSDVYGFENYISTYASYYDNDPDHANYIELVPQSKQIFDGDSTSGAFSVTIPQDIFETIKIPDNDPSVIMMNVACVQHLKPLGTEYTSMEDYLSVDINVKIYLDMSFFVPVTGLVQEESEYALDETGENEGTIVNSDIVEGGETIFTGPVGVVIGIGGGVGAAIATATMDTVTRKKKRSTYKMLINKNFGSVIRKGAPPVYVFARMVEITPEGATKDRPDLTAKIVPYSADGLLEVADAGMSGSYKAAQVTALHGTNAAEGRVSFMFQGDGGTFTDHVIFSLTEARINFGQENLGLPAHYEKQIDLYFTVSNMPENMNVTAKFISDKPPYSLELKRDPEEPRGFYLKIKDILTNDEKEPGTTQTWPIQVRAEATITGADGSKYQDFAETNFSVLRIFMGLSLQLDEDAIGCYLNIKDGAREMASKRAAGSNLGKELATPMTALDPTGSMISAGMNASIGAATGSRVREEDKILCITRGNLMLLYWDDEEQMIKRVAVYPDKEIQVRALTVENDKRSTVGDAEGRHQAMVDKLKIRCFPTNELDEKTGARRVMFCTTEAGLDRPVRLRANLIVNATYKKETYTVKKKVLLHSMPFRISKTTQEYQDQLGYDNRVRLFLEKMREEIWDHYMRHLSSLYYFAGRMIDGYSKEFGFDQKQVDKVIDYWNKFRRGEFKGKNGEAVKVTIKDDLAACIAFIEGMRDNGGIIGRIALGVCTAGYSEVLFFGMELHDKMKEAVFNCSGDEFGFWDGVALGLKEYEKQVAIELLIGGAFKLGNNAIGRVTGIDLGATISNNWRGAMDAADKALRAKFKPYGATANILDGIKAFTTGGAEAYKKAMEKGAAEDAAAEAKATTIAQRRRGDLGKTPQQMKDMRIHDLANQRAMDNVNDLWKAEQDLAAARRGGRHRNGGVSDGPAYEAAAKNAKAVADAEAAYEAAWEKVKFDKDSFKKLKYYDGPNGQTMRAKFTEVRHKHDARIMEGILNDVSAKTGIPRNELYIETVSGHADAWKETAGLTLPEDVDMNVRQIVYSDRGGNLVSSPDARYSATGNDIIVAQKIGEEAMINNVYKEFHDGKLPTDMDAAKEFVEAVDYTYVQPWQGLEGDLEITFNQEAFIELEKVINPAHFGEDLNATRMNQLTLEHKSMEWKKRAEKHQRLADSLELQAEAATGAERQALLDQADDLRIKAHGEEVESIRQLVKGGDNTIGPRSEYRDGEGLGSSYTEKAKEIVATGRKVQEGMDPHAYFDYLESDHGESYEAAVKEVTGCLR